MLVYISYSQIFKKNLSELKFFLNIWVYEPIKYLIYFIFSFILIFKNTIIDNIYIKSFSSFFFVVESYTCQVGAPLLSSIPIFLHNFNWIYSCYFYW
jgi:hypothetical protein